MMSLAQFSARAEAILSTYAVTILFFITYGISVGLMFLWGLYSELSAKIDPDRELLFDWLIGTARGAGYILNFNTALVILLASRLFITALRDTAFATALPLDKAFPKLHVVVGYTILLTLFIHVPFHFAWLGRFNGWAAGLWNFNMTVATGIALLLVFIVMFVYARPKIRKDHFRLFYAVHLVGAFLFFLLLIFHGMYYADPETYKYISGPIVIYIFDRIIRRWRVSTHDLDLSEENSTFRENNVLELRIPKPFDFRPGQYAEIKVPSINQEWHPFTIASAQYESTMTFYIKALGDWTTTLYEAFQGRRSGVEDAPLKVRVRGPFGAPAQQVERYQRIVLVSGGIGATPFMSICKQLHFLHSKSNSHMCGQELAKRKERALQDAHLADGAEAQIKKSIESIYGFNISNLDIDSALQQSTKAQYLRSDESSDGEKKAINAKSTESFTETESDLDDNLTSDQPVTSGTSLQSRQEFSKGLNKAEENEGSSAETVLDIHPPAPAYRSKMEKISTDEILTPAERHAKMKAARRKNARTNLLLFFHSSQVSFLLCVLAVCRLAVVIAGSIFKTDYVMFAFIQEIAEEPPKGAWVPLAYASLTVPIAFVILLTISLEVSFWKGRTFRSVKRSVEVIMFGPILIALTAIEFWRWKSETHGGQAVILLQYVIFQFIIILLLLSRMLRAVGKCGLHIDDDKGICGPHDSMSIPEVDFIWTARNSDEDSWLRRELCEVTDGRAVRVHRYVTRGKESDKHVGCSLRSAEEGHGHAVEMITETGRPDFDKLLALAARDTKSDGVIGLFFCGPDKMGQGLRQSARKVETWSNLRDVYLRSTDTLTLMHDLKIADPNVVLRLRKYGCRVRFVFIEENFG